MIECLGKRGSGNRTGHILETDRSELLRRQRCGEPARIKGMTIARQTHEAGYVVIADVIQDLCAFESVSAPIVMREDAVAGARPLGSAALREIMKIGAHIGRAHRIAP